MVGAPDREIFGLIYLYRLTKYTETTTQDTFSWIRWYLQDTSGAASRRRFARHFANFPPHAKKHARGLDDLGWPVTFGTHLTKTPCL